MLGVVGAQPGVPVRRCLAIIAVWAMVRLLLLPLIDPVLMRGDDVEYVQGAHELLAGHGLAGRSPAYSAFLAATLWLGPKGIFALQSLATLVAALVALIYLGFWPALLIAACPFFPMFEWSLLTEPWSVSLLWCGWVLIFWPKRRTDPWLGGFLCGLVILMRTTFLLLPLLAIAILVAQKARRTALVVAIAGYVPVAIVLPQTHGNNYLGYVLWVGTWERDGLWKTYTLEDWPSYATRSPEEHDRLMRAWRTRDDKPFRDTVISLYQTQPTRIVSAWVHRYPWLWIGTRSDLTQFALPRHSLVWTVFKGSLSLLNFAVLALGLVGAVVSVLKRSRAALLVVPIVYIGLIYIPFHNTETRYSLPAVPFLIALGCYAVGLISPLRLSTGLDQIKLDTRVERPRTAQAGVMSNVRNGRNLRLAPMTFFAICTEGGTVLGRPVSSPSCAPAWRQRSHSAISSSLDTCRASDLPSLPSTPALPRSQTASRQPQQAACTSCRVNRENAARPSQQPTSLCANDAESVWVWALYATACRSGQSISLAPFVARHRAAL